MNETEVREVNIPLLRKAVEWAEAEAMKPPELCEWEQRYWVIRRGEGHWAEDSYLRNRAPECGTTYCIAGYICEVAGEGASVAAGSRAAELLGIEYSIEGVYGDGDRLFDAANTIEDVRRIAEEIAGERL